jgi:hypothetical protein
MSTEQINRWVPVIGRWDLNEPGRAIYLGPQSWQDRPYGICVCNSRLSAGNASVTVQISQFGREQPSARLLFGFRDVQGEYYSIGVGGYDAAYVLSHYDPGGGWRSVKVAGSFDYLKPAQPYELTVSVKGLRVAVSDGDTRVFEHVLQSPIPLGQLGLFAWGHDRVEFTRMLVEEQPDTAFVVMQFTPPYTELYSEVIKKVTENQFGLKAFHAGEVFGRVILQDIISGILDARVVIAEITPANKNVFYEVGYAHGRNVPTVLLVAKGTELPFDIRGYRCILYDNTIAGKSQMEKELGHHLDAILNG